MLEPLTRFLKSGVIAASGVLAAGDVAGLFRKR
jgi:hypothetical protein